MNRIEDHRLRDTVTTATTEYRDTEKKLKREKRRQLECIELASTNDDQGVRGIHGYVDTLINGIHQVYQIQ